MLSKYNRFSLSVIITAPVLIAALTQIAIANGLDDIWGVAIRGLCMPLFSFVSQGIIQIILLLPVFFFAKKLEWSELDFAALSIPWSVWALLILLAPSSKSLSNYFLEGIAIGGAAPIGTFCRIVLTNRVSKGNAVIIPIAISCVLAVCLWYFPPTLSE